MLVVKRGGVVGEDGGDDEDVGVGAGGVEADFAQVGVESCHEASGHVIDADVAETGSKGLQDQVVAYEAGVHTVAAGLFQIGVGQGLEATAEMYGFESAEALLKSDVGPGADLEDYQHFLNLYYTGSMYFSDLCEKDVPTDQEVEDYFTANEEAYAESGLTRDNKTVDVRHVLIMPEGATSENIRTETFEDAAWESSRQKAEELLKQFEQGDKSEDSFAELAKAHSQDGSAASGGLYSGVPGLINSVKIWISSSIWWKKTASSFL